MLFFNLTNLLKAGENNSNKIVNELERYYLYKSNKLNGYYLPKVSLFGGSSFLINPKELFMDISHTDFKAQYILLAGRRDYTLYKEYKITTLDLSFFPDLQIDKIKNNPLLDITTQHIKFKFE